MFCRFLSCIAPAAAVAVVLCVTAPAQAIGYWNVPGNFCQCFGYGWGAGHHACFVLGPPNCDGFLAHGEVRLPHAPQPASACHYYGASAYDFRRPAEFAPNTYEPTLEAQPASLSESNLEPTPDPLTMPEERVPARPIFDAPVER